MDAQAQADTLCLSSGRPVLPHVSRNIKIPSSRGRCSTTSPRDIFAARVLKYRHLLPWEVDMLRPREPQLREADVVTRVMKY